MDCSRIFCFLVYLIIPWNIVQCQVIDTDALLNEAQHNVVDITADDDTSDGPDPASNSTVADDTAVLRQAARLWDRARLIAELSGERGEEVSEEDIETARRQRQESNKRRRLEQIRTDILRQLGLPEPPSQRPPTLSPGEVDEILRQLNASLRFHCLSASCNMPEFNTSHSRSRPNPKSMELFFNMPSCSRGCSEITHSILKLRLRDDEDCRCHGRRRGSDIHDTRFEVRVYQYLGRLKSNGRPRKRLLDTEMVCPTEERWVLLNIRTAVRYWMRAPETNYGLEIVVRNTEEQRLDANRIFVVLNCSSNETNTCEPVSTVDDVLGVPHRILTDYESSLAPNLHLVINYTQEITIRLPRVRRQATQRRAIPKPYCVKDTTFISFKELGWEGVISPESMFFSRCRCIPGLMEGVPRAAECNDCHPTRSRSLPILHFDDQGNVVISVLEHFIVQECG